jgi:trimethylamine monooxygenase
MCDYIKGRIDKTDVRKWCKFKHVVRDIKYDEDKKKFVVAAEDLSAKTKETNLFDYVCVCSGHFSTPNVPSFPGFETFAGRIMHAHDFRDAEEMRGKNILIIGTSYSAEDIASQCYKYGVKSVTCSWRTNPMSFHWPDNFKTVPLLDHVDDRSKTCHFKDGSTADIDVIILCTGYLHHFPFISDELRLKTANKLTPDNLYKSIFWENNTNLMYFGMADQWYTFNHFDAQAWYARDYMLGRIELPPKDVRLADDKKWSDREGTLESDEDMFSFQGSQVKELIEATDYPTFDIDGVNKTFLEWEHHKHDNIMTFRDKGFKSLMTGNMAPVHHTPWLEAMDDSMECYLRSAPEATKQNGSGGYKS